MFYLIINTVVTGILLAAIGLFFSKYKKKREEENLAKGKARQLDKRKLERVYIAITSVERGLEKVAVMNGDYTKTKNEVKEDLEKNSDILNEPLMQ